MEHYLTPNKEDPFAWDEVGHNLTPEELHHNYNEPYACETVGQYLIPDTEGLQHNYDEPNAWDAGNQ